MGWRRSGMPAGAGDVLAALASYPGGPRRIAELIRMTGLDAGQVLSALIVLESCGWVRAAPSSDASYVLAPLPDVEGAIRGEAIADLVVPAAVLGVSRPEGTKARQVSAVSRAAIDAGVAKFGFLRAARYRDELRATMTEFGWVGQIRQATSTLQLRNHADRWESRGRCHLGRHDFRPRHDQGSSFASAYYECNRCGAFQNSLFGGAGQQQVLQVSSSS